MVPLAAARRLALLTLVTLLAGLLAAAVPVRGAGAAPGVQGRVWLVDAVDDEQGSRWVSQDTGTSTITIQVGDTVEWTFDRAGLEHDLTSLDTGTPWPEPIQRYFFPGEAGMLQTFTQPGTYFYVCTLHNTEMTGVVIVEDPDGNRAPTGTATVAPQSGPAPLDVHFTAAGFTDPDGDQLTYAWDFGTGRAMDRSTQAHAMFRYETPGTYVAWLTVSDGHGGEFVRQFPIQVAAGSGDGGDGGSGGDQDTLPEVAAVATPASGTAPLEVALSTETTTRGTFAAYADGLASYPALTGTARITRARGRTEVAIDVTGLAPGKAHLVHVHDNPCAVSNAGAHFRFDEAQPFGEANELWL
ncbi:PKD domain-containing protein, partial [Nocardioides sp. J9]|uniref:PKD domain-containing protein n=1 Tax=Nocardioides sp. J9 TaxID=935844 RepID=UPI001645F240